MASDCWGPHPFKYYVDSLPEVEIASTLDAPPDPKETPVKIIVSKHYTNSDIALRMWWLESPHDRGVVFANDSVRAAWVNSWELQENRELALRMTFTVTSAFYGRDDLKELAVADANNTLPLLFKRLGVSGRLDLIAGTSPLGNGW